MIYPVTRARKITTISLAPVGADRHRYTIYRFNARRSSREENNARKTKPTGSSLRFVYTYIPWRGGMIRDMTIMRALSL